MNLSQSDLKKVLAAMEKTLPPQPVLTFSVKTGRLTVFDSKLGGTPYFPKDMEYPCVESGVKAGKPLVLLAQLNFEELPHIPDFPTRGILQFFIDDDDCYGCDFSDAMRQDSYRVIYHGTILRDESKLLTASDCPKPTEYGLPFEGEFKLVPCAPSLMSATTCDYRFDKAFTEGFSEVTGKEIESFLDLDQETVDTIFANDHRYDAFIGGYPVFSQEDPRAYNEKLSEFDVVLFELDSFEDRSSHEGEVVAVMWGDCGTGSFLISRENLKNLDFSRVLYNFDCC